MENEKMKILQMLEEGKITAADASKLLQSVGKNSGGAPVNQGGSYQSSSNSPNQAPRATPPPQTPPVNKPDRNAAEDLGRKFDNFMKGMEPKIHRFASTVAEKANETAAKVSRSMEEMTAPRPTPPRAAPPRVGRDAPTKAYSYPEKHFEAAIKGENNELNLSGFNGTILVKGYNGDKITAKIIFDPKIPGQEPEMMVLGDKYFLHYDETMFNLVAVEAFVPEFMFNRIYIKQREGNIQVSNMQGTILDVATGKGRLVLEDLQFANISAKANDGEIHIERVRGDIGKMENHNGKIFSHLIDIKELQMETTNGDILVSASDFSKASQYIWFLSASNGQLITNVPSSPQVGYHIKGRTALGNIQMGLTSVDILSQTSTNIEAQSTYFDKAKTTVKLSLETSNGSLIIN